MTEKPKISVIVAVMNGVDHIGRCIASVAGQSHTAKELIVIDGGSTDGTVEFLRNCESESVQWWSEPDSGISEAWNKGVARASGEWLCFLGADDYLASPTALADAAALLEEIPSHHLIAYGDVNLVHNNGDLIERSGSPWDSERFKRNGMLFSHQGIFHHRKLFHELGPFDCSYRLAGDYEWLLRAITRTEPIYLCGLTVAAMQTGGRAADERNSMLVLSEYARAQRHHLGRLVPWVLGWTALKVIMKLFLAKTIGAQGAYWVVDGYRLITGRAPRRKK